MVWGIFALTGNIDNPGGIKLGEVNKNGGSSASLYSDSLSGKPGYTAGKTELERFAAQTELKSYIASLCEEHFDDIQAVEVERDNIRLAHKDGSFSLLNYENDPLNIVNVNWESARKETQKENDMSKQADPNAGQETPKVVTAEPKAVQEAPKEPIADPNAGQESRRSESRYSFWHDRGHDTFRRRELCGDQEQAYRGNQSREDQLFH